MAELLNSSRWICASKMLFQAVMDSKYSACTMLLFMCHTFHPANSSAYFSTEPLKFQCNESYTLFSAANYPPAYLFVVSMIIILNPKLFYKNVSVVQKSII